MRIKKLFWQLFFGYVGIMLLPLLAASWYTWHLYNRFYTRHAAAAETTNARLAAREVFPLVQAGKNREVDSLCKQLGRDIGIRITVVLPSGKVIGDSERDPDSMENHAYRPEIMDALRGRSGVSQRLSSTLGIPMLYVASPLRGAGGSIAAVVRIALPQSSILADLRAYHLRIAFAAGIAALAAALLSLALVNHITRPVRALEAGAERFTKGDFSGKIPLSGIDELRRLAATFNTMAEQLSERIKTITRQRSEQEAILSGMSEAVIVIDASEKIVFVNNAAVALFGIDVRTAPGRLLSEVIRASELQRFAADVLAGGPVQEKDIALPGAKAAPSQTDRFVQVHGTLMRETSGTTAGAMLVASDVTRLRRLEQVRKDFVANVSHELRTPITAIKGFVETIASGGLENREESLRFLGIIAGQVDRLSSIIDDLMTLTLVERAEETETPVFAPQQLEEAVRAAVRQQEKAAAGRGVTLAVIVENIITLSMNAPLIEQAVANLIDNAIKYSEAGTGVEIRISRNNGEAVVAVRDRGIGIPREHLDRIFERFYRVDKARSRKLGGTGLGLSIVKHIVSVHRGRVTVESEVGKGSTFSIILPV